MSHTVAAHPLASLAHSLREADAVLVPADAAARDPFAGSATDVLRSLCASGFARGLVARAAARWTVGGDDACELLEGVVAMPVRIPRQLGLGQFAAVAVLDDALACDSVVRLAHGAGADARLAQSILGLSGTWQRASIGRLSGLVGALATSEGERLAGLEASNQLGAAWEELHLLHSLSGDMALGASPMKFVTRTLAEVRQTLGCRWTALRVHGAAAQLLGLSSGGLLDDGLTSAEARRALDAVGQVARAQVANPELVVAPVRRESDAIGVLAAGGASSHGEHGMSSVERALVETAASHLAVFLDNARLYRDLDGMFMGALSALVSAIDAKDPYTRGHSQRVALLSRQIAEAAGLSAGEVKQAHIAGLVHDVGKIGVPESILRKQGRLDDDEFAQIKEHPETGFRILRDIPQFAPVLGGVRHHHERYDGLGYPHGISGESIPLLARVIAIADTFDAMSSTRTYRSARPRPQVLAEIARCAGNQLDPALVPVFLSLDLRAYDAMSESHGSGHRFTGREAA